MKALIRGNVALCCHVEQVRFQLGKRPITTAHLYSGFLVLTGPVAGVSGNLPDN